MTVRPFVPEDIPEVRTLWSACEGLGDGPGDAPDALARFLARNPGLSPVALDGARIVGAALCGHDGRRGFLYRVGVDPLARRRGVARALAAHAFATLNGAGITRVMFFVKEESVDAQDFWRAIGGRKRGELGLWSVDL